MPPRPRGREAAQLLRNADPGPPTLPPPALGKGLSRAAPPLLPCAALILAPRAGRRGGSGGLAFVGGRGSGGLWKVGWSGLRRALSSSRGPQAPGSAPCCPARWEEAPPTGAQSCGPSVGAAFSGCCRLGARPGAFHLRGFAAGKSDAWLVPEPFLRFFLECKAAR